MALNKTRDNRERKIRRAVNKLVEDSARARRDPSFRRPKINAVEDLVKFRKFKARNLRMS